jgi:hypothetical protein
MVIERAAETQRGSGAPSAALRLCGSAALRLCGSAALRLCVSAALREMQSADPWTQNAVPFTRVPGDDCSELSVVCSTKLPLADASGLRFIDTPSVPASDEV